MKEIKIKLPSEQAKKFETIQWLTDPMGPRGSGRTHLLALAFITHSLKYGISIPIYDHDFHPYSKKGMILIIEKIVSGMEGFTVAFKGMHNQLTKILVTPKENHIYEGVKYEKKDSNW